MACCDGWGVVPERKGTWKGKIRLEEGPKLEASESEEVSADQAKTGGSAKP